MYYQLASSQMIHGKVLLDQTIALDLQARGISNDAVVEKVPKEELGEIIERYKLLFSIDSDY